MLHDKRIETEKKIAREILNAAEKEGYTFVIDNGGDEGEEEKAATATEAYDKMFASDEDRVYLMKDGRTRGWVYFVYGNDGWDVVSDYTVNFESIVEPVTDKYQEQS